MSDVLVRIQNLAHTYLPGTPLETVALLDAHLTIQQGSINALIGPSGAGKSTLVHYVNTLLRPSQPGRVIVLGQDTASESCDLNRIRRDVGLVFQAPHHQLLERYVGDDVAFGPRRMGLSGPALRERVRWAMEAVELSFEDFKDRLTFTLSGGEMRRVAIAGVLAVRPTLMILDEATTGLDPRGCTAVHTVLRRMRDEEGMTVLIVSNDMEKVAELAEQVTGLHEGRTVLSGPASEVMGTKGTLQRYGLEPPSGQAIVRTFEDRGLPIDTRAITLAQAQEAIWQAMTP